MYDAVVISDLHLGSPNCQAKQLARFLEGVRKGPLAAKRLILNGDVFDSIDFRRLKRRHWDVLSELRKLSDDVEIIWDRRAERDRRQQIECAPAERRANDRRRLLDSSWNVLMPQAPTAWSVLFYAVMKATHCQQLSGDDNGRRQA